MFFKNSFIVVVNGRIYNYYQNLSEAALMASRLTKSRAVVTVEDMMGNVVKVLTNSSDSK